MCWIKNVLLFPFSFNLIILRFVFRISVKMFRKLIQTPEPVTEVTPDRLDGKDFGPDMRVRKGSVFEPRSRYDSGIGLRSRHSSGGSEVVRSRHNSGNTESRSRHGSGSGTST